MTDDPVSVAGGRTLTEVLAVLEARGYTGHMGSRPGGRIVCFSCHNGADVHEYRLGTLARTEGASDPDDMLAVAGLICLRCGARGTLIANFGPETTEEDAVVLRQLEGLVPEEENPV
jgi:hypothetical protein